MKIFIYSVILSILTACSGGVKNETQHIISYGQSLSLGESSVVSYPSDMSLPNDYQDVGLMFEDGVRSLGFSSKLINFKEARISLDYDTWVTPTTGETPLYGALLVLKGVSGTRIGSAAGRGGTSISGLSKGTIPYDRLIQQVKTAKSLIGDGYVVPAIIWLQGERDANNTNYANEFLSLVQDLNADIRNITNQSKDVQFHVCLTSFPIPAQGQITAANENPNIHIDCNTGDYQKVDGLHLSASDSRDVGRKLGVSIARSSF